MASKQCDFVIVGSGAGGATLARELAVRGQSVLVLERGKHEEKVGTYKDAGRFYDISSKLTNMPRKSKEGVVLWRAFINIYAPLMGDYVNEGVKSDEPCTSEMD